MHISDAYYLLDVMNLIRVIWRTRNGVEFPQSFIDFVTHQISICRKMKLLTNASCDRLARLIGGDDGAQ